VNTSQPPARQTAPDSCARYRRSCTAPPRRLVPAHQFRPGSRDPDLLARSRLGGEPEQVPVQALVLGRGGLRGEHGAPAARVRGVVAGHRETPVRCRRG
jgi:hypothetical protein